MPPSVVLKTKYNHKKKLLKNISLQFTKALLYLWSRLTPTNLGDAVICYPHLDGETGRGRLSACDQCEAPISMLRRMDMEVVTLRPVP